MWGGGGGGAEGRWGVGVVKSILQYANLYLVSEIYVVQNT